MEQCLRKFQPVKESRFWNSDHFQIYLPLQANIFEFKLNKEPTE